METKTVVLVIAPQEFRDEEFIETRKVLEEAGFRVQVASKTKDTAIGKHGTEVVPDITLADINTETTDALVFIGGRGGSGYYQDPRALGLAKIMHNAGKVVAAICAAPVILANAGILQGGMATCDVSVANEMKKKGTVCTGKPVEVDDRVITGQNVDAAKSFGQAIADRLRK